MTGDSTPTPSDRSESEAPISAERIIPVAEQVRIVPQKGSVIALSAPGQPLVVSYGRSAPILSDSTAIEPKPSDSSKKKKCR